MSILLDIIIVGIVALCVFFGKKKGFIYTAVELFGWLIIAVLVLSISTVISEWFYDAFIRASVYDKAYSAISNTADGEFNGSFSVYLDSLPSFISNSLADSGVTADYLTNLNNGADSVANYLADVIKPIICPLISIPISFIMFIGGLFLIRMLARLISNIVKHIPIVGKLNTVLGGCIGGVKGLVLSVIFVSVITAVASVGILSAIGVDADTVSNTYIFNALGFLSK